LRRGPGGEIYGLDLTAVLALMRLKGCESAEVAELVQSGEEALADAARRRQEET
jgi:hypothetical protein